MIGDSYNVAQSTSEKVQTAIPGTTIRQEMDLMILGPRSIDNYVFAGLAVVAIALATLPSCTSEPASKPATDRSALLDSTHSTEPAPEVFRVRFETSRGPFVVEMHRAWSPWGVDRFYYLVRRGFYDGTRFFRVIDGFMAQFGINGDPGIATAWKDRIMPDDTVRHQNNLRGRVAFGSRGPNTRTTQLFINFRDNVNLDEGYPPIGEVIEGMNVVDSLWKGYGEGAPAGRGPDQDRIFAEGESYLARDFPQLDIINTARILK